MAIEIPKGETPEEDNIYNTPIIVPGDVAETDDSRYYKNHQPNSGLKKVSENLFWHSTEELADLLHPDIPDNSVPPDNVINEITKNVPRIYPKNPIK